MNELTRAKATLYGQLLLQKTLTDKENEMVVLLCLDPDLRAQMRKEFEKELGKL